MGITDRKTIELGLGFLKFGKTIGWEMGFGQNLGWENGIYTPPSGPSLKMVGALIRLSGTLQLNADNTWTVSLLLGLVGLELAE